ncbi:DNA polymerase/3'-5' exonuclease PolX [Planctomycetota bacterium]
MKNQEIADIFNKIADALEFKSEDTFRINAYRRAARVISELATSIESIHAKGELREIPGIGEGIAKKIDEYLKTGKMQKLTEVTHDLSDGLLNLLSVQGVGPKTLSLAYKKLGVRSLDDLKQVIDDGRLAKLPMMGERKVANIDRGVALFSKFKGRMLLGRALPLVDEIIELLKTKPGIKQISPAGSLRRMQETVGDIDILVTGEHPQKIIDYFIHLPQVKNVLAAGETKASIILDGERQVDLRVVEESSYGAALQYFTGSKAHNIRLRGMAKERGLKINEYGVFKDDRRLAGETEKDVYQTLKLPWIPPELREDRGEIEAALNGQLPDLVNYDALRGDLHIHSHYSDGASSIEAIALEAKRLDYEYICITDHSRVARYAGGLSVAKLAQQVEEIKQVNRHLKGITVLAGTEMDILADGEVDFPNEVLKKLDFVIGSIHSGFKQNVTARILKAMENPYVNVIAHPTGRLISTREGYKDLDLEAVFKKAAQTKTALEINAFPDRLDLNDINVKRAKELGICFTIGTDTHRVDMMKYAHMGLAVARRGWLTQADILNTYPLVQLKRMLRS